MTEPEQVETPEGTEEAAQEAAPEPEVFSRDYVEELRAEAAAARVKGKRADALAVELVRAIAATTGKLCDPRDLPYSDALLNESGMPDLERVNDAVDTLVRERPHLASRRPVGDIGQGVRAEPEQMNLMSMLRAGAS